MINYDVPLNSRGNNANIKTSLSVGDDTMKANGFIQRDGRWSLMRNLGYEITLYIHVLCDTVLIDVIDEEFLQPYDYQMYLGNNSESKVPMEIHRKVQDTMERLSTAGIIEGWVANDYI